MSIDNTYTAIYRGAMPNAAATKLLEIPLPAGTLTGVRVKLFGLTTVAVPDDVVFNIDLDGSDLFTNELTVPDGDDEIDATGLSETTTNDSLATLNIDSPFVSGSLDDVTSIAVHLTFADVSVQLTGNQTIAGVKTFSSDPIIPDEAYGVGWNGSLEPPTKNAVYDKIETISAGGVDTANSPGAGEWAKFTDADTIEGRTDAELIADLSLEVGVDLQAHDDFLDDIAALTDPAADRVLFWDDSAGAVTWLTVGTNLSITDDTISASLAGGAVDTANSPNAGEWAKFTDADTIEGRTDAELLADLNLEIGTDIQAYDADLDTWAGITPGTNVGTQLALNANGSDDEAIGYRGIPQNSQSDNYTLVMADAGKHIYETGASKTVTIPANASVAFPIGTTVTFIATDAGGCTIAITSDTLRLSDDGTTGSVTLAQYGIATAIKVTSTEWLISGTGVS